MATLGWLCLWLCVCSLLEHLIHRHVMHTPCPGLRGICRGHRQHHAEYPSGSMQETTRRSPPDDLWLPGWLLLLLVAVALPLAWAVPAAGVPLVVLVSLHWLVWGLIHTHMHTGAHGWVRWIPGYGALARHHARHHVRPDRNLNVILVPFADWLLGTWERGERR